MRATRGRIRGAGGADRGVDPGVRLQQSGAGGRRERHHRGAWAGAGGAEAGARDGAGDRAGASDARRRSGPTFSPTTGWPSRRAGTGSCWRWRLGDLADLGIDLGDARLRGGGAGRAAARQARRTRARRRRPSRRPIRSSRPGDLWLLGRAPADLRRCHRRGRRWRGCWTASRPHLMVTDPPYGVDYDPGLAQPGRGVADEAHRQGAERRPGRLARGLGAVSRRRRLCLARRAACDHRGREPDRLRLRDPHRRSSGPRSGWC